MHGEHVHNRSVHGECVHGECVHGKMNLCRTSLSTGNVCAVGLYKCM